VFAVRVLAVLLGKIGHFYEFHRNRCTNSF
jgi:hypothetical protein